MDDTALGLLILQTLLGRRDGLAELLEALIAERDEARQERGEALKLAEEFKEAALDYRNDAKEGMSDYLWTKHHGRDHELYPHLIEPPPP